MSVGGKNPECRVVVVMGVSGSGKSTVARLLAAALDAAVLDGDFLHPRANVDKMARGEPLDDADRAPWLAALNDAAYAMARTNALSFIVCSALKRRYRDRLRQGHPGMRFLYLRARRDFLEARLTARSGHFFKPAMLASQFEALEEPQADETDVITVNADAGLEEVLMNARKLLENGAD